ncbi:MAG: DegV family protein, partial [Eggerthellaceae bacterium]|nr:DegV family protein [Eggerthellaceae bacterium]
MAEFGKNKKPDYLLVFDSCVDIPRELLDDENIAILNCRCNIGDTEYLDDLYQSVSAGEFFKMMRDGALPQTSQPSIAQIREVFEKPLRRGQSVVCFCFSSKLSGTYETTAHIAEQIREELIAEGVQNPGEIYVIDTALASIAVGIVALEAIRLRTAGLTPSELASWAQEAKYFVNGCFMVDRFDWLVAGGRIPQVVASFGSMLDVKPMLKFSLEGALVPFSVAHGRKKGIKQMAEYYLKHVEDINDGHVIIIGNADCQKDA